MSDFPGYIEIECPFCDQYRHVTDEELAALKGRQINEPTTIVCDRCWKLLRRIIRKRRARKGKT